MGSLPKASKRDRGVEMNDKDHEIVCQQYEALLKKLQAENADLKAEVHKWVEAAKGLNRENIACIQTNGKLKARWEEMKK